MTFFFNGVKKFAGAILVLCLLASSIAWADNGFVVNPVQGPEQVRLLPAQTWPPGEDQTELMFKLAYIRGLLDAWQLSTLAPKATSQVLENMQGASLLDLVRALDKYYQDKNNQLPPGSVLLRIISPSYKEGAEQHE